MVGGARGRGTGRWQRRASEIGLGTPRLYPDEACVCARACISGDSGQGQDGVRGQWQKKRSVVLVAASCSLGLRNLEGQLKARPQKAGCGEQTPSHEEMQPFNKYSWSALHCAGLELGIHEVEKRDKVPVLVDLASSWVNIISK